MWGLKQDISKSKFVGITNIHQNEWGLRGDCVGTKNYYTLCVGLAWGSPHKVLSSGDLPTQSPRKDFPVGIVWGGFAWVSEAGV